MTFLISVAAGLVSYMFIGACFAIIEMTLTDNDWSNATFLSWPFFLWMIFKKGE